MRMSDERLPAIFVPASLADDLRRLAEQDCSSLSGTVRRLLARALAREFETVRTRGEFRETRTQAGVC